MDSNDDRYIRAIVKEEMAKYNSSISNTSHNSTSHNSTSHKKKKGNREPTKWQIFLGDCSRKQPKDMSMGNKVKACSVQYKKIKESNPKLLDDMVAKIQSQNQNINRSSPTNRPPMPLPPTPSINYNKQIKK